MGERTGIAWCDHTFNPWAGCARISPGCDACYAEAWARRYNFVEWGPHAERRRTSEAKWREVLRWDDKAERAGKRARVFCASLSDIFDNAAPDAWRADLWALISQTPALDWLILTKRPGNIAKMLPGNWGDGYANTWLGVTAENQAEFDRRWPELAPIPAAVRFVSYEPALGPLHIGAARPDWLICGAEQGPHDKPLRPMLVQWARDIRDECAAVGTAFFMKQLEIDGRVTDDPAAFPTTSEIREWVP